MSLPRTIVTWTLVLGKRRKPVGGEVMLLLEKGETAKIKRVLTESSYTAPKTDPKDPYPASCWLNWRGNRLEIGYSFGGEFGSEWANAIAHEIIKRFKVKKGGWDSVGYCKTLEEYLSCCEPFHAQFKMLERAGKLMKVIGWITKERAYYKHSLALYIKAAAALFETKPKRK
jgi:hypothetical protein